MNNSDLKRILNKLTAAAPFLSDALTYDETPIAKEKDPCEEMKKHPILMQISMIALDLGVRLVGHTDDPVRLGKAQKELYSHVLSNLINFIEKYCECNEKEPFSMQTGNKSYIGFKLTDAFRAESIHSDFFGKKLAIGISLYLELLVGKFSAKNKSPSDFCRDTDDLRWNPEVDIFSEVIQGGISQLNDSLLLELTPNAINNSITPCAQPKVAIIEDYLVEQGLAIGVAGILGATALGLYLRGNRAAAVALIATATAAVGGTATGAESVMNDVETDYNRSVRFGGQQDCRDSNQTGSEMSGGD